VGLTTDLRAFEGGVGELLARHEQAQSVTDYSRYADDPAGFIRNVLHGEPWSRQVEMAERLRDKPADKTGVLVVTCNGIGKDWMTARMALWWCMARRGFVILTGPTERQVKHILMREVRRAFARAPKLPGELFSLALHVDDDCGILAFTSDNADKLTGFHHPRLAIFITEGQGVEEEAYEAARRCCTGAENRLFVYGNPNSPNTPFHSAATFGTWDVMTVSAAEHPNVVSGREEIQGAVTREWIAQQAREYGSSSAVYLSSVLARFPEDAVDGLFRRQWLLDAFARHESNALELESWRHRVTLGADVARSLGGDQTVVAVCRGPVVERLVSWRSPDLTVTEEKVVALAKEYTWDVAQIGTKFADLAGPPRIVVDSVGVGGGPTDRLKRLGYPVTAFNGAHRSPHPDRHLNMRSSAYWGVRELLQKGLIALPRSTELLDEAAATEYQLTAKGLVQIVSKDTIRSTLGGKSPDSLDAIVLGLAHSTGALSRAARPFTYSLSY
jgi:phage terminase large subunit